MYRTAPLAKHRSSAALNASHSFWQTLIFVASVREWEELVAVKELDRRAPYFETTTVLARSGLQWCVSSWRSRSDAADQCGDLASLPRYHLVPTLSQMPDQDGSTALSRYSSIRSPRRQISPDADHGKGALNGPFEGAPIAASTWME